MPAAGLLVALLLQTAGGAAAKTASISGRVTDKASGQPLPRMLVALFSTDRTDQADTVTDADGRYTFRGLAGGKYAVGADNDEHVATYLRQWFGDEEPGDLFSPPPPASIEIATGEARADVDLALTRALAIEGHVFDPVGEPVRGVDVSVTHADGRTPGARVATTDDLGAYRVYGLRAGQYRVCGAKPGELSFSAAADAMLARTCYPDLAVTTQDSFNIDIHMQPADPPRATPDAPLPPSTTSGDARATGAIRGVIVDKETGRPVARASVRLAQRGDSRLSGEYRTSTDGEGVFTFAGLAPGRYDGYAAASGHVLSPLIDRASGGLLTVQQGETLKISVSLPRSYAITVRLIDQFGTPISGVGVSAESSGGGSGGFPLGTLTDDLGRLRVPDLAPGRYRLCADPGYLAPPSARPPSKRDRLLRTCYPSAPNDAEAQTVTVANADVDDVEIRIRRGRVLSISGTIYDATGSPAPAVASLAQFTTTGMTSSGFLVGRDGRFRVPNIQPGAYAIEATTSREGAFVPVRVVDDDIEDLVVAMRSTTSVTGRITLDDSTAALPDASGRPPIIMTTRLADERLPGHGSSRTTTVNSDGTFTLNELFGRRTIEVENEPRGWYVKAIRYGDRDVTEAPVEFNDDHQQIEVVLSNHGATLSGSVEEVIDKRVTRAQVFLFTAPASKDDRTRLAGLVLSVSGSYRFGPLRAGDYTIVAVPADVPMPAPADWERLAQLAALGEHVTLTELDQRTIDLRVVSVR